MKKMMNKIKHYMKWNFMTGILALGILLYMGEMPCIGEFKYILKDMGIFVLDFLFCVMAIGGHCTSIAVPMQHLGQQRL